MIKIGNREISKNSSPFIIAEVGINHNGNLEQACKMIEMAKNAGADAVKFQTFKANEFIADANQMFTYKSRGQTITESMLEMFLKYEFQEEEWIKIKQKCDEENILFLSTPQNISDLELLLRLGITAIKIGSDDFTNIPLIKEYSKTRLPIILSCGMADLAEVYQALETVGAFEGYPAALLLCTSEYPTPAEHVNLLKLKTLRDTFNDLILGFSDHTQGPLASSLAVAMGAVIFEKHFTLDNNLPGPDHWFSENPDSLKLWCDSIHTAYSMLGESLVTPTAAEREMRLIARRSLVALTDIKKNEVLSEKNIGMRRPGDGIAASEYEKIIGKKTKKNIVKNTKLKWEDLE
jgi:N,N'-diacetyllegionaminate synthase